MEVPEPGMQKNMSMASGRQLVSPRLQLPPQNYSAQGLVLREKLSLMRPARQSHAIVYRWAWKITHSILAWSQVPPLLLCISFSFNSFFGTLAKDARLELHTWQPFLIITGIDFLQLLCQKKTMDYHLTLGLSLDTTVTFIHTMWESTDWKLYIVRIIGGKQWSHLLFICDSSGIPKLQVQSHMYLSTCTLIWQNSKSHFNWILCSQLIFFFFFWSIIS